MADAVPFHTHWLRHTRPPRPLMNQVSYDASSSDARVESDASPRGGKGRVTDRNRARPCVDHAQSKAVGPALWPAYSIFRSGQKTNGAAFSSTALPCQRLPTLRHNVKFEVRDNRNPSKNVERKRNRTRIPWNSTEQKRKERAIMITPTCGKPITRIMTSTHMRSPFMTHLSSLHSK